MSERKHQLEIAGLGLALLGTIISLYVSIATRIDVRDQRHLQAVELLKARNERIERWAASIVDTMTEGVFICAQIAAERSGKQLALMSKLSSQIDQGRFIVPNESPEAFGHANPPAFRGYRPKVLEHPIALYDIVARGACTESDSKDPLKSERNDLRRKFVSDAQELLDPARFNARLKQLEERLSGKA